MMKERYRFKVYLDHGYTLLSDCGCLSSGEIENWNKIFRNLLILENFKIPVNGNVVFVHPHKVVAVKVIRCWSWARILKVFKL